MNANLISAALLALATMPFTAIADDDWEPRHRRAVAKYKHEYRDGNCKIERKRKKNGDHKEERHCRGRQPDVVMFPGPVYVPTPAVVVGPGITVRGAIEVK